MRIGYFADGKWGQNAFQKLVSMEDIQIAFVCLRFDTPDSVLRQMAENEQVDVLLHPNVNSDDFFNVVEKYEVDLFISMSFNQIFKSRLINYPEYKTINCHAGKLPFYRGRNILNWVLINDEKEFGITVHYMDTGIDTGDIILQKVFPITDNDTYQTLLDTAYRECPQILASAIQSILDGTVTPRKQSEIHPIGMYCGRRTIGDEHIDWNQTSRQVFNFVRAICFPGPMARSTVSRGDESFELKINRVRMILGAPSYIGIPGQVLYKSEHGIVVKTLDSFVEVTEYEANRAIWIGDRLK